MVAHGLSQALERTEVAVLTKDRVATVFFIQIGEAMADRRNLR